MKAHLEYTHHRVLNDTFFIACYRTVFGNGRLVLATDLGPVGNWCYPNLVDAVIAMNEWENPGMGDDRRPPDGWFREIHSGMRRTDSDPDKEYFAP